MRVIRVLAVALTVGIGMGSPAMADGFKDCTKLDKASWKPAGDAEAKAKAISPARARCLQRVWGRCACLHLCQLAAAAVGYSVGG